MVGNPLEDVAWTGETFAFKIASRWLTCPWAGHSLREISVGTGAQLLSNQRDFGRKDWLSAQWEKALQTEGKIVDVLAEGVDPELGFNDPGENWLLFDNGKCLTVCYPVAIFGESLPSLIVQESTAVSTRSPIQSYFDIPILDDDEPN